MRLTKQQKIDIVVFKMLTIENYECVVVANSDKEAEDFINKVESRLRRLNIRLDGSKIKRTIEENEVS